MKLTLVYFITVTLFATACCQTCSLTNIISSAGAFTYTQQSNEGFCRELVVGPVNSLMTIFTTFQSLNVNCNNGDKFQVFSPERTLVYDYCNQRTVTYVKLDTKYLIFRLVTPTSAVITLTFNLYLLAPSTNVSTTTTNAPITTTTAAATNTSVNSLTCGISTIKPNEALLRIVGGIEVVPNSWPWQAFLTDGSFLCGASLIDNEWLVTAAHCIYGMSTGKLKVYLGIHTLNRMESTTVMRMVTKIIQYPSYNPQTLDHDIALLKISAVNYSSTISPICLPKQGDNIAQPGKTGFVTGWGKVSGYGSTSDVLRQVNINVIQCPFSNANMICAGQQAPSIVHDSCQGDSGGPFAIKQGSNYYLSGIVSWGGAECLGDGVYTKVSNYINWINNMKQSN